MKQKAKLLIILAVEFVAIAAILLLIFFAGKKVYTVTFDLNGGTLLSGNTVQRVTQGQSADPPQVAKDGASFRSWSGSYNRVTSDRVLKAVWEYETTPGIIYSISPENEDRDFCTIIGSYEGLHGDVYIDAFRGDKKVLAIEKGAFENRSQITSMYLLDGIIEIGDNAFKNCSAMETIEIPATVRKIGKNAFEGCSSLKTVVLPEELVNLGEYAFSGCEALEVVIIPETVKIIGANAFGGDLTVNVYFEETEKPVGWANNCFGNATVVWGYEDELLEDEEEEEKKK